MAGEPHKIRDLRGNIILLLVTKLVTPWNKKPASQPVYQFLVTVGISISPQIPLSRIATPCLSFSVFY